MGARGCWLRERLARRASCCTESLPECAISSSLPVPISDTNIIFFFSPPQPPRPFFLPSFLTFSPSLSFFLSPFFLFWRALADLFLMFKAPTQAVFQTAPPPPLENFASVFNRKWPMYSCWGNTLGAGCGGSFSRAPLGDIDILASIYCVPHRSLVHGLPVGLSPAVACWCRAGGAGSLL